MSDFQSYEKIVKVSNRGKNLTKKISIIFAYVLFFGIWSAIALRMADFAPILLSGVLLTILLVVFTWKYLFVEYEYSFSYGMLSVAKIYAKRRRTELLSTQMKELLIIAPATEEYINKAEHFEIEKRIIAISDENAENIWLAVTGGKDEKRVLVFFEADERSLAILKAATPHVFIKKK